MPCGSGEISHGIHGTHRILSTYWHVSSRIFLNHEWARTEGRASQFTLMPCGAISVSSEEVVGSSEPCGVELFHADGADFRRSMRSKILCVPWISV
jgi:hypothetical protein